jgi:hypothetical protein
MAPPPETFFESFSLLPVGLARMAPDAQRLEVRYVVRAAFALRLDVIDLCFSLARTDATTGSTGVCVTHQHDLP